MGANVQKYPAKPRKSMKKRASSPFFWRGERDYLRLYEQAEKQGYYERLDGFAVADVRSREPTAEKALPHSKTFRRLWFKPSQQQRPRDGKNAISGSWRGERDLRLWRRALVGARRTSRASAFGKRHAFTACSSSSRKSFASQNLCGSPAISPPGCSVCAHPICFLTIRAQTARSHSRLHPQIPLKNGTTEKGADESQLPFPCL